MIQFELGRFYSVPTVRGRIYNVDLDWPVLGPKHDDSEIIGFRYNHYHVDWRFLSNRDFRRIAGRSRVTLYGTVLHESAVNQNLPPPTMRRRRYYRTFEAISSYPHHQIPWLAKLEAAYSNCNMKNMVCPHRGVPLKGCEQDGKVVTCPGHGLRWNVNTGELIPFVEAK